jgi:hypothetical protein
MQILSDFREEVRKEFCDIRQNMATKEDLNNMATNMATKEDLNKLAMNTASKGDLGLLVEALVRPDVARRRGIDYAMPFLARSVQDLVDQLPLETVLVGPEEIQVRSLQSCLGVAERYCPLPWLAELAGGV